MEKYYSIGKAAKAVNMTSEALRHYDRIGLVKPSKVDKWTNYRYYTDEDIVRLNTVYALQQMDLPLKKIKQVLEYNQLEKIIDFLSEAKRLAQQKINALKNSKAKIELVKRDYEKKLSKQKIDKDLFIKDFEKRVILLSKTLTSPSLDNLWNYLSHFYEQLGPELNDQFEFKDLAGVFSENGNSHLFAQCTKYCNTDTIRVLPKGKYLCANCNEGEREKVKEKLLKKANEDYGVYPDSIIEIIVVSGILQWDYQIQVLIK